MNRHQAQHEVSKMLDQDVLELYKYMTEQITTESTSETLFDITIAEWFEIVGNVAKGRKLIFLKE